MWVYEQLTGRMTKDGGTVLARGYSGAGEGKNNPTEENVREVGPIPEGFYDIEEPIWSDKLGPYVMALFPDAGNHMYGRSAFYIHGDSKENPGHASEGCIILPRFAREVIWQSTDHRLQVVKEIAQTA